MYCASPSVPHLIYPVPTSAFIPFIAFDIKWINCSTTQKGHSGPHTRHMFWEVNFKQQKPLPFSWKCPYLLEHTAFSWPVSLIPHWLLFNGPINWKKKLFGCKGNKWRTGKQRSDKSAQTQQDEDNDKETSSRKVQPDKNKTVIATVCPDIFLKNLFCYIFIVQKDKNEQSLSSFSTLVRWLLEFFLETQAWLIFPRLLVLLSHLIWLCGCDIECDSTTSCPKYTACL